MKQLIVILLLTVMLDSFVVAEEKDNETFTISAGLGSNIDLMHLIKTKDFNSSRKTNNRNGIVDRHLSERGIILPNDNYLVISVQPCGIVERTIIADLDARIVRIIPGTHSNRMIKDVSITENEYAFIYELLSSSVMVNFPSKSGNHGLDGYSLVIYSKSKNVERYISHYSPDYIGIDIFTSIQKRFMGKSNKSE